MSQHQNQNLPLVPKSEAGVKPFAIRQYVLACRDRNISQNWPYEEKHLQLCLKSGLMEKELLPPLEPLNGFSKMHSPNDNNSKETDSCNAEVPQECNYKVSNHHPSSQPEETCSLSGSTNFHNNSPPLKTVKCKRRRRKGKCKKRFMVDILAMAQHSTLEEIDGMNKFFYAQTVVEGCHEQAVDDDSCRKGGSEDDGMANADVTPKGLLLLKLSSMDVM
ncbi:hypothetical protein LR48_Vigan02g270800 [Vigna angularis]|uniref:Uncharacterized protein n=2 Tax=Phaseolus angularis TaxID=3914 RepID=A0A0L9U160_PHAAN|nr:uncharacterized protein LOC108325660 [Vigna angularis]KAG2401006.1 uncharacterized protein HKW66_Vig0199580 [Vigna angularis]KOM36558.1 hypothetical protein LR48_Vigan02g270800 [Vigna angularis]BAT93565.1 hypothetical protein VIGAN_08007700 [Vigna angularis var. angularis]